MRIELTLKNYRCFPDSSPARIVIEDGKWTAFVGVNNSGKSSLLRFFFEFRSMFEILSNISHLRGLARGGEPTMGVSASVRDATEVFHKDNARPLTVEIRVSATTKEDGECDISLTDITVEYRREKPTALHLISMKYYSNNHFPLSNNVNTVDDSALQNGNVRADTKMFQEAMRRLLTTFYVGAFRNLLNTGAKANYFDIQVGDAFISQWRAMQTGNSMQGNAATEEVTAAIERLFGYDRFTAQAAETNDTLQLTINLFFPRLPVSERLTVGG